MLPIIRPSLIVQFASIATISLVIAPRETHAERLDARPAIHGEVELYPGFRAPFSVSVTAHGHISLERFERGMRLNDYTVSGECVGFVGPSAHLTLWWDPTEKLESLYFFVESQADTVLLVSSPGVIVTDYVCSDDDDGRDPLVYFQDGVAGTYDIWVGVYEKGIEGDATLHISETPP